MSGGEPRVQFSREALDAIAHLIGYVCPHCRIWGWPARLAAGGYLCDQCKRVLVRPRLDSEGEIVWPAEGPEARERS